MSPSKAQENEVGTTSTTNDVFRFRSLAT